MHFCEKPLPGAAFTYGKIYSIEGLGYKTMMEYVRSLKRKGIRGFVAANTPGHYGVAANVDVGLLENRDPRWRRNMRHIMGSKPFVWSGRLAVDAISKKKIVLEAVLEGIHLYGGEFQDISGRWLKFQEEITRLASLGWKPVRRAKISDNLRIERFGEGLGSCLVAGNPKQSRQKASIRIDPFAIRDVTGLYFIEGRKLSWKSKRGGGLRTEIFLEGLGYRIMKQLMEIRHPDVRIVSCDAVWRGDKISASVSFSGETTGDILFLAPEGTLIREASVNGEQAENNTFSFSGKTLEIEYLVEDEFFINPCRNDVEEFPFLNSGKAAAVIVPSGNSALKLCNRLSDYFSFWDAWQRLPLDLQGMPSTKEEVLKNMLHIPVAAKIPPGMHTVTVGVISKNSVWEKQLSPEARSALDAGRPVIAVMRNGRCQLMVAGGRNYDAARQALFGLLAVLDAKYKLRKKSIRKT